MTHPVERTFSIGAVRNQGKEPFLYPTKEEGKKSIFFACQGTRGDVQPYANLGCYLASCNWNVSIGAPPEFKSFIESQPAPLNFVDIGPAPTVLYEKSVSGKGIGKGLSAYNDAKDLFNPSVGTPFTETWFRKMIQACEILRPDVMVLIFTSLCGAAAIPSMLGLSTKVVLSYPMPMAPTSEFCVSMAGTGFSMCCGAFNKAQWKVSEYMIAKRIHLQAARRIVLSVAKEKGLPEVHLDDSFNLDGAPAIFCYSPALLPKPKDWPSCCHVVGQLSKARSTKVSQVALPSKLQQYLNTSRAQGFKIIYIGFGSLGFFSEERVTALLDCIASAVKDVAETYKIRAVIQTTLSSRPGKTGCLSLQENGAPYIDFSETVDHAALFSQVSLVISHGGVGTVQTALGVGTPCLSICCLPTADQSFWADLVYKRKLGPKWFWIDNLDKKRFTNSLRDGIDNLPRYSANAKRMALDMAKEDGLAVTGSILNKLVVNKNK